MFRRWRDKNFYPGVFDADGKWTEFVWDNETQFPGATRGGPRKLTNVSTPPREHEWSPNEKQEYLYVFTGVKGKDWDVAWLERSKRWLLRFEGEHPFPLPVQEWKDTKPPKMFGQGDDTGIVLPKTVNLDELFIRNAQGKVMDVTGQHELLFD